LLQGIQNRQVFTARDLDPFLIVHGVELGQSTQPVLLLDRLQDVAVARCRRQQFMEFGVVFDKALPIDFAFQQFHLAFAATTELFGVDLEGRLQQPGWLQQHAEAVALEASLRAIQRRQELPAVAVLALLHAFVGKAQQAAAQHAFADPIAAQQVALGDLVGQHLVQTVVDQPRVQLVLFVVQLGEVLRQAFGGFQRYAIALLRQRLNGFLFGQVRQCAANGRARDAQALGQFHFLEVQTGLQVAAGDGGKDLAGDFGLQRGELGHGARSFL